MKSVDWHSRSRTERLANVMYPALADEPTKRQMLDLAANEGKQAGLLKRMQTNTSNEVRKPVRNYDGVPGLRRK